MRDKSKAMAAVIDGSILGLETLRQGAGLEPQGVIDEVRRLETQYETWLTDEQRGRLRRLRLASLETMGEIVV